MKNHTILLSVCLRLGSSFSLPGWKHAPSPVVWRVSPEEGLPTGDMPLYTAEPGAVNLPPHTTDRVIVEHIEGVPGAFRLLNVLSKEECQVLIDVSTAMGYKEVEEGKNYHAALTWVADHDTFLAPLFERCRSYLPSVLLQDCALMGLNARLRCYRYKADSASTFKPHRDDSFPCSGLDASGKIMHWDSYGDRASLLTFLLYLNDDFDGGQTSFFSDEGVQDSVIKVKPVAGSVLCFWQTTSLGGYERENASLAPLHEGSPVHKRRSGTTRPKYVVRSDVLYTLGS